VNAELKPYQLTDCYQQTEGRVYMTGTQALVRVLLNQSASDKAAGLNTGGFVSGYRGSPLGGVDLELWRQKQRIAEAGIEFLPAVNEDLAATAVLGSQQVETNPDKTVDGVYGLWYGKGPGIDRSGDALKHGNALNPSTVAEYLEFGEYGYALSRYSGMWVGFKAISETVESAASFDLKKPRQFVTPDFEIPADGLHYRWPDLPGPQIEERLVAKKNAVFAFAEANPIDKHIYNIPDAPFGIVTTGKAHLDLMEALRLLGIDKNMCRSKKEVLVVEEKRGIIESQFKEYFYDWPGDKPDLMVGKRDQQGKPLVPWTGELSPGILLPIVAKRLQHFYPEHNFVAAAEQILTGNKTMISVEGATRTPYFCSGCPHNTSTKVPEGSKALAGIGQLDGSRNHLTHSNGW